MTGGGIERVRGASSALPPRTAPNHTQRGFWPATSSTHTSPLIWPLRLSPPLDC